MGKPLLKGLLTREGSFTSVEAYNLRILGF